MKKVIILIGNYGSGKTEIALNMAVMAAAEGKRVQVIDLDRINDYFRMSDHVKLLEESNINLVSPTFVGAGITQTNMPAAVGSAFAQDWDLVVFDVGGDPAGALSLARYHMDFAALEPGQLEVYDIINVRRPMSETPEKILKRDGGLCPPDRHRLHQQFQSSGLGQRRGPARRLSHRQGCQRDERHSGRPHHGAEGVSGRIPAGRGTGSELHWHPHRAGDLYAPQLGQLRDMKQEKARNHCGFEPFFIYSIHGKS